MSKHSSHKEKVMGNGPITNYALFCKYMDNILQQNISSQTGNTELSDVINQSPHSAFWDNMSYSTFINPQTTVPGVGVGPIVTPGNATASLLVQILQGPAQGFAQMPADGPPYFTAAQLQPIIDWINAGCPNQT